MSHTRLALCTCVTFAACTHDEMSNNHLLINGNSNNQRILSNASYPRAYACHADGLWPPNLHESPCHSAWKLCKSFASAQTCVLAPLLAGTACTFKTRRHAWSCAQGKLAACPSDQYKAATMDPKHQGQLGDRLNR